MDLGKVESNLDLASIIKNDKKVVVYFYSTAIKYCFAIVL